MTTDGLAQEEDLPSEPADRDARAGGTTIDVNQSVGAVTGGRAIGVEIGTIVGPVYIQSASPAPALPTEDLRLPAIKTGRFEPETIVIPAGAFWMGSDDPGAPAPERHRHQVVLPAFRLGRFPVTLRQYAAFIKDKREHPAPSEWFNREPPKERLDHPVTDVSWNDAQAYCAWLSRQTGRHYVLPSEAEWEKAASWSQAAGEKRARPWGNEWLEGLCNAGGSSTTPVGAHAAGASAYGVEDLLGNVQEWTCSLWGDQPAQPEFGYPYDPADGREVTSPQELPPLARLVHRGGYFKSAPADLRCTARGNALADSKVAWRGFRVALKIE
jgi:iron(II)-dependent oxidoreductase